MKKITYLVAPLMVLPFLVACNNGGGNTPESTYSITFKNEGEEDKKIENIKAGSIVTEGIPTPGKQPGDAEFIGWCTDTESKNVFDFNTIKIYQDYTLYSGWSSDAPIPEVHKFTIASSLVSKYFTFTDASGSKLDFDKSYAITRNKDFVFNVSTSKGTISSEYMIAFYGDDITTATPVPMDCELSEDEMSAKFTIHKQDIVDDITLAGMEHKDGMYLFDFPYAYACSQKVDVECEGAEWEEGDWYGYAPIDQDLKVIFSGTPEHMPAIDNIVFYKDGATIDIPTENGSNGVKYEYAEPVGGTARVTLTVIPNTITDSLFVIARSKTSSILDLLSWSEIKDISESGYAGNFFMLGEEKTVLINGHSHKVRIIGFDHDDLADGSGEKAGITFQFSNVISDTYGQMSGTIWAKNNNNFKNSTLKTSLDAVYNSDDALPSDLKDSIKEVSKSVNIYEEGAWGSQTYNTHLFPLSASEVDSTKTTGEGSQYDFYAAAQTEGKLSTALKVRAASGTNYVNYWLRSPTKNTDSQKAYTVNTSGKVVSKDTNDYSYGMLPAFCI